MSIFTRPPHLRLGLTLASRTRDVLALTRYALAFAELESRLRHVSPASFVEEFLQMQRPNLARRCLRTGNDLHTNRAYALQAARWFFDYGDQTEAAILFMLAEPATVKADALVLDGNIRFEEARQVLEEWVMVAFHFQPLATLLARLNNIQLTGTHWQAHETAVHLRFTLLQHLALRVTALNDWAALDAVLAEFCPTNERRTKVFFEVVQAAIHRCLASDDQEQANYYLELLLREFPLETLKDTPRIYVADLIYKVRGDLELVRAWLDQVSQPTGMGRDLAGFDDSLDEYEPFILLNKLLRLCGIEVPVATAAPALRPGAEEQILVDFLQMVWLSTYLLADGLAGTIQLENLTERIRPIVRFYYLAPRVPYYHRHRYWSRLLRLQGAYFDLLISAVATIGPPALQQLATYLLQEFAATPAAWPPDVRRSTVVALVEQGYDQAQAKPMLLALEATMLDGKDADGRVTACRAQAQAWLTAGDFAAAERQLQQALREAAGVEYRKDYQLNTWLLWLRQINVQQPTQAADRLRWFLARLPHVRDTTDGGSFWSASEALLETTLAWNFSAGQQQLQWQLAQGLIHLDGALETFITSFLGRTTTTAEFNSILRLYTIVYLPQAATDSAWLLTTLLTRGFTLFGVQLFADYLPALIEVVNREAPEKVCSELLRAIESFVVTQGQDVASYYPNFVIPPSREGHSTSSGNSLTLLPDHQQLNEAEVLARVTTYENLRELLVQEDAANSYFDWDKVLEQLSPVLSAAQIQELAASLVHTRRTSRTSLLLSTLSGLALQAGAGALARQLADRAIHTSQATGWVEGYDGGTRLRAFAALKRVNPALAMQRAFDVFGHDLATTTTISLYIEDLDAILPLEREDN